jgi:NAD(P)-dependent dehydrogenase (short-subunit alcohol dehydrogenase family)
MSTLSVLWFELEAAKDRLNEALAESKVLGKDQDQNLPGSLTHTLGVLTRPLMRGEPAVVRIDFAERLKWKRGRVDVLVNNAGISCILPAKAIRSPETLGDKISQSTQKI